MATTIMPAHVARSFDRLTHLVCTASEPALGALLAQLEGKGTITPEERAIVAQAHRAFHHGVSDEEFTQHGERIIAAMEAAQGHREMRFLNWYDTFMERAYCLH